MFSIAERAARQWFDGSLGWTWTDNFFDRGEAARLDGRLWLCFTRLFGLGFYCSFDDRNLRLLGDGNVAPSDCQCNRHGELEGAKLVVSGHESGLSG
jgi:hypothetical protein